MKSSTYTIVISALLGLLTSLGNAQAAPAQSRQSLSLVAMNTDSSRLPATEAPATFIRYPTEYTTPGYLDPQYAYDGNLSTAAIGNVVQGVKGAKSEFETWYGFPSTPPHASGMKLNITSSASLSGGGDVQLSYSLNGGSTFTSVYFLDAPGSRSKQTDSITLANTQDLTKIQVKGGVTALSIGGSGASQAIQDVYEINVTGTD